LTRRERGTPRDSIAPGRSSLPPAHVSASVSVSSSYRFRALFLGMSGLELREVCFVHFETERSRGGGVAERALIIPAGSIGPRPLIVSCRELWIQREARVEIAQGSLRIAGIRPGEAPPAIGVRLAGFETEILVIIADGGGILLLHAECGPAIQIGFGIIWLEFDRPVKVCERLIVLRQVKIDGAPAVERDRQVALYGERLVQVGEGEIVPPRHQIDVSPVTERFGVVRLYFEGFIVIGR